MYMDSVGMLFATDVRIVTFDLFLQLAARVDRRGRPLHEWTRDACSSCSIRTCS